MSFDKILQEMLACEGVEAVVFLDSEGETILSYGIQEKEKLKALGAYQGILLSAAGRLGLQDDRTIITMYQERSILTHHVKDGYFISVIFREVSFGKLQFRLQDTYRLLEQEL
jgi:hypothetical protein